MRATKLIYASIVLFTLHLHAINLPTVPVTVTVTAGSDSFFNFRLTDLARGFDVCTNTYLAWCAQLVNTNDPSLDGGVHGALLLSTTGPLPAPWDTKPWDKINYLLNHRQGEMIDLQYAIWHFTDGFTPNEEEHPAAIAMIADAEAFGEGFVPGVDDIVAVLVLWQGNGVTIQHCIIEVPPSTLKCADRFTSGGFVFRDGKKVTFGIRAGLKNGKLSGGLNFVDHGLKLHVRSKDITSYTVLDDFCRRATFNATVSGESVVVTVRACDYGEPGTNDVMEITMSNGYSAGVGSTLGGDGPGGGNVQLHIPRCNKRRQ
jgi:hypothetical protein